MKRLKNSDLGLNLDTKTTTLDEELLAKKKKSSF